MRLAEVEHIAAILKVNLVMILKVGNLLKGLNGSMRGVTGELEMSIVPRLVPSGLKNEQMKKKKRRGKTRTKAMNPSSATCNNQINADTITYISINQISG